MPTFANGESAASVRTKINDAINKVDGATEITVLNVNGTIKLDGNYPVGTGNVALGDEALDDAGLTGTNNVAVGASAVTCNTSGGCNTGVGSLALRDNTTAGRVTGLGYSALRANTTGACNTAVGAFAAVCNTTGANNVAIGSSALSSNVEGDQSVAVGNQALASQNPVGNADMNNVAVGFQAALCTTTGAGNTAVGSCALRLNTTGCNNTATGRDALFANTTGFFNTAAGLNALRCNTTGASNTASGVSALFANTTGCFNTASGVNALCANVEGDQSTALGYEALRNQNPVGNVDMNNVAVGFQAALCTTTATSNTAVGACSLRLNTTGANNSALGLQALGNITTGSCNTAVGHLAMTSTTTGGNSAAFGASALRCNTTGEGNTALGIFALCANVEGDQSVAVGNDALRNQNPVGNADMNNVAVGYQAGCAITTGTNLIVIGATAAASSATATNEITLGNSSVSCLRVPGVGFTSATTGTVLPGDVTIADKIVHSGDTDTSIRFPAADTVTVETAGTERMRITSTGNVGIGTTSPSQKLDIVGDATSAGIELKNNLGQGLNLTGGSSGVSILTPNALPITFSTTNTERMRIDSSGNVGIGTSSPTNLLAVKKDQTADTAIEVSNLGSVGANTTASFIVSETAGSPVGWFRRYRDGTARTNIGYKSNLTFSSDIDTTPVERMRIDSSGNVGIGTSSPSAKLHVASGGSPADLELKFDTGAGSTGANFVDFNHSRSAGNFTFSFAGTERLRIDSSGNVGIGTTSPATTLDVNGDVTITDKIIHSGDTNTAIRFPAADTVTVETAGTERMRIDSSGNVGIGTTTPAQILTVQAPIPIIQLVDSNLTTRVANIGGDNGNVTIDIDPAQTAAASFFSVDIDDTERLRITSTGSVGIGTSSPAAKLEVSGDTLSVFNGTTSVVARSGDNTNYSQLRLRQTATESRLESFAAGTGTFAPLTFHVNSAERMRITTAGNVGIGTTSPGQLLDVRGNTGSNIGAQIKNDGAGRAILEIDSGGTSDAFLSFKNQATLTARIRSGPTDYLAFGVGSANTERARIDASGNLLVGGTAAGTSSAGNLVLVNGTAPTGNVTNGITLFAEDVSASSELKVRDEAGNVTTLSPHNFDLIPEGPSEDMAWSYYSERDGKRINVDMLKAIRLLEQITGEKLVHIV